MRRECQERFPRHRRWAIPTCITARASRTCRDACRDRQLSVSFEIGGGGKRSRHSRRMRNLQFYVSGKRPMEDCMSNIVFGAMPTLLCARTSTDVMLTKFVSRRAQWRIKKIFELICIWIIKCLDDMVYDTIVWWLWYTRRRYQHILCCYITLIIDWIRQGQCQQNDLYLCKPGIIAYCAV